MSARPMLLLLAALSGTLILSCAKKSSEPTAPRQQGPICDLSADKISFDQVQLGEWVDSPLVIKNIGSGTLTGTVVDTSSAFLLIGVPGYTLTAGESTAVTLRFQPLALGDRVTVVRAGACAVELSGTGVAPVILDCNVNPTTIDFGTVPVGQAVDRTFTLTNQSTSQITGSLTDTSAVFTVPGSSSYNLSPGQTATFIVRFTSSRPGLNACVVQTGQPGCPTVTCSAVSQPICAISTDRLEFGLVPAGVTTKKSFTITNVGSAPLVGVLGTDGTCPGYHIEGDLISYNLASGQTLTVTVDFNAFGTEGLFTCTILTGNPGCPNITCSALAQVL